MTPYFIGLGVLAVLACIYLFARFAEFERREEEFYRRLRELPERDPVRLFVVRDGRRVTYTERPSGPYDRQREDGGL